MTKIKIKNCIVLLVLLILGFALLPLNLSKVKADTIDKDGVYKVPYDNSDLSMGAKYFSDYVLIEKQNDNYYMTLIQKDSTYLRNMKIIRKDKKEHGVVVKEDGIQKSFTYTVTLDDIKKGFDFFVHVTAMGGMDLNFFVKPKLEKAIFTDIPLDLENDLPPLFVPQMEVNGEDMEAEMGSYYILPNVKATIGENELEVNIKAFYNEEEITFKDNKIHLENIGEYKIIFSAQSDEYKSSKGNNSKVEKTIIITSKIGASSLVKLGKNNNLPKDINIQGERIDKNSEVYNLIEKKMKKLSDNYDAINVRLYNSNGDEVVLDSETEIFVMANSTIDRTKTKVYLLEEDGSLTSLDSSGYGRYVKILTDKTGTFIVCNLGVAFHMPMWGYMAIGIGSIVLIAGIIITIVLVTKKRKKKAKVI